MYRRRSARATLTVFIMLPLFGGIVGCGAITERVAADKIEIEQYNTITDAYNSVVAAERVLVECQGETDCSAAAAGSLQASLQELTEKTDGLSQGGSDTCSLAKANIFYHSGQASGAASTISELAGDLTRGEKEGAKGDALARTVREYNATVDTLNARMNDIEKSYLSIRDNCLSNDVLVPTTSEDVSTGETAPGDDAVPGVGGPETSGAGEEQVDVQRSSVGESPE